MSIGGVIVVQCFFSNTLDGSIRIHIASAFGAGDVVVLGETTVNVLIRAGTVVVTIFDLSDGSLLLTTPINVTPTGTQVGGGTFPTWTILNGGLLQFPDGHTSGGSSAGNFGASVSSAVA